MQRLLSEAPRQEVGGQEGAERQGQPLGWVSVPNTVGPTWPGLPVSGPLAPDAACRGQGGRDGLREASARTGEAAGLRV